MKAIGISAVLLALLCSLDFVRGVQFRDDFIDAVRQTESEVTVAGIENNGEKNIQLVEEALASRWTQWGAVGIMLSLFTYIITVRDPKQAEKKDAVIAEFRDSFIETIDRRDSLYLASIDKLRDSAERNSERTAESHAKVSECMVRIVSKLDGMHP